MPDAQQQVGIGRLLATNPADPRAREFLLIKSKATIGSDESNDFVIRDAAVSRFHAIVSFEQGRLEIKDLNSTNGTFVNGQRVNGSTAFDKGDRLRFGAVDFVFLRNVVVVASTQAALSQAAPRITRSGQKRGISSRAVDDRPRLAAIGASGPPDYRLIRRKVTIGSDPKNLLVLNDGTVSKRHAILKRRFRNYSLIDLESSNGTFVNGRRVNRRTSVARGDELRFGSERFVFLQSPTTRELRRRVSPRTMFTLLFVLLVVGFAIAERYINGLLAKRLIASSQRESVASTNLAMERDAAKAILATARSQASQPGWLRRVNYYRNLANLQSVTENASLDHADLLHARYLVKYQLRTNSQAFAHSETEGDPYFTNEGLAAAQRSDISGPGKMPESGESAVDGWMRGAFHRLSILDPSVREAGFASYTESGLQASALYLPVPPGSPHPLEKPIEFPPSNSTVPLAVYEGWEWPDPLTSCPGYVAPTGLAVTFQLGSSVPVTATVHSFTHNGTALEHCAFAASSYVNPDEQTQSWARDGLKTHSAVILIPRAPLASGERYTVSITANSQTYAWSFSVE